MGTKGLFYSAAAITLHGLLQFQRSPPSDCTGTKLHLLHERRNVLFFTALLLFRFQLF